MCREALISLAENSIDMLKNSGTLAISYLYQKISIRIFPVVTKQGC